MNLKVLSYHVFGEEENAYEFSRTYKQFRHDLQTKDFDWITIDDGHKSVVKACKMMRDKNIRAKVFISTALIGLPNYLTWGEVWHLSRFHDIENHSHLHIRLTEVPFDNVEEQISAASHLIHQHTGRQPRYFVPPWNQTNPDIEFVAQSYGMQTVKDRTNILNNTL